MNNLSRISKIQIIRKSANKKPGFLDRIPKTPGVYVYFSVLNKPIYIGKAINLKKRVSSYFDLNLEQKTRKMIGEADRIGIIRVDTELQALLLEAKLIRKFMPKYNIAAKDDKHPLYIVITKEKYPRVLPVRKLEANGFNIQKSYGPFPSSSSVKSVLKMLRRIFPYSDHKLGKRACIYSHIGLCNPCPNVVEQSGGKQILRKLYLSNIRNIQTILDGKITKVYGELKRLMLQNSDKLDFEAAVRYREQIRRLEYITKPSVPADSYLENPNLYEDLRRRELKDLSSVLGLKKVTRIECFDVAHLAGSFATASMVTFVDGEPDKSLYRHFRIKSAKGGNDYESMKEVARRRFFYYKNKFKIDGNKSWGYSDVILIDGGAAQVKAFKDGMNGFNKSVVVGIAKNPDRLIVGSEKILLGGPVYNLVRRIRDEAHRFARRYHHKLVSNSIMNKLTKKR